jgi:hypothetical protein
VFVRDRGGCAALNSLHLCTPSLRLLRNYASVHAIFELCVHTVNGMGDLV